MTHLTDSIALEASRRTDANAARLTPCPDGIKDLLFILEALPPGCELPDLSEEFAPYSFDRLAPRTLSETIDGIAPGVAALKAYESRIGTVEDYLTAYRIIVNRIKHLPRVIRWHLWTSEIRTLAPTYREHGDEPTYANDEERDVLRFEVKLLEEIVEDFNLVDGDVEECAAKLAADLALQGTLSWDDEYWNLLRAVEKEYTYLRESRIKLLKLIRHNALLEQGVSASRLVGPDANVDLEEVTVAGFLRALDPIRCESTIEIDDFGIARLYTDDFAVAIDGVDVTRIRECKICSRIFWAGRKDSLCCSPSCADKRRKRQHRARYKERLAGGPIAAQPAPKRRRASPVS